MGWGTLDDGQHIWIGPKGNVEPREPGSKSEAAVAKARKLAARTATDDWMNHISRATGGQKTRTYRTLLRLREI
jgi:hypothetical protein